MGDDGIHISLARITYGWLHDGDTMAFFISLGLTDDTSGAHLLT
jgi:hypothetical protein